MTHSWTIRRRIIIASLIFVALCVGKIILADSPTPGQVSLAEALVYAAVGIIGSYVFGATWDDKGRS